MDLFWLFDGKRIPYETKVMHDTGLYFFAYAEPGRCCGIVLFNSSLNGLSATAQIVRDGGTEKKEFIGNGFECLEKAANWINTETARFPQAVTA